jgi:hypothetical protein
VLVISVFVPLIKSPTTKGKEPSVIVNSPVTLLGVDNVVITAAADVFDIEKLIFFYVFILIYLFNVGFN